MQARDFPTVVWSAWDVDATFIAGELPEESRGRLWAVLAIVFYEGNVLLADISGRGWCIPSGKIEPGETIYDAIRRETYEETGATLDAAGLRILGCYRLTSRRNAADVRYCPVFVADASGFGPIPRGSESRGISFAAALDLPAVYFTWDPLMAAVFDYAVDVRRNYME